MSSKRVRDIIEPYLLSEWGSTTPITWDMTDRIQFPGKDFIACTLNMTFTERKGKRCQRETHLFVIEVYGKRSSGPKAILENTEELSNIFFDYQSGYLRVKTVRDERVGSIESSSQRNVLIEIEYDHHY